MTRRQEIGQRGESAAEYFLTAHGCRVVGRNVRVGHDEIDLVIQDGPSYVAVEVKTTTRGRDPCDAIDDAKMDRICRAARRLRLDIARIDVVAVRFDDEGVTFRWARSVA